VKHLCIEGSDTKGKPIKFVVENVRTNTLCVRRTVINEEEEVFFDN